jgi:hypothetical protein
VSADHFGALEETRSFIALMSRYMEQHMIREGDALFVAYPFPYAVYDKQFQSRWYSTLGNAFALSGLEAIYQRTGEEKHKALIAQPEKPLDHLYRR